MVDGLTLMTLKRLSWPRPCVSLNSVHCGYVRVTSLRITFSHGHHSDEFGVLLASTRAFSSSEGLPEQRSEVNGYTESNDILEPRRVLLRVRRPVVHELVPHHPFIFEIACERKGFRGACSKRARLPSLSMVSVLRLLQIESARPCL